MRRLLAAILVLLLIVGGLAYGAVRYARPAAPLDLAYSEVSIPAKFNEMVKRRQLAIELSDTDINNLLKKKLAEQPVIRPDVKVTGAHFDMNRNLLTADINLLYRDRFPVGVRLKYRLEWNEPNLTAVFQNATVKRFTLPDGWLDPGDFTINVNDQLPQPVGIKEVVFGDRVVNVWLTLRGIPGL